MSLYSTITVEYNRCYEFLRLICRVGCLVVEEIKLEVKLDYTFEHHDQIRNFSYEIDSGKYEPYEYVSAIKMIRKIFTNLDMNVDKYLDEFKKKLEETYPDILDSDSECEDED